MKFIIFSDAHGMTATMQKALGRNKTGLDGMIFLGDGLSCAKQLASDAGLPLYAVAGNCDFGVEITKKSTYEQLLDLGGVRVLIMHGHRYQVKHGLDCAVDYAHSQSADVLLFGHTHLRLDTYLPDYGLNVFNPGSISLPNDGNPSFGLMEIRNKSVLLSHGTV